MRAIDADALEKEGWSLHRTIQVDKNTSEYQIKPLKQVPTIEPEPCEDAVSRRKIFEYFVPLWECIGTIMDREEWEDVCKTTANEIPSVTPKRKTGRWVPVTNGRGGHECDKCHEYAPSWTTGEEHLTNYCPNCGADMRGEQDG